MARRKPAPRAGSELPHNEFDVWDALERQETARRWEATIREVGSVVKRLQDIRFAAPQGHAREIGADEKKRFLEVLFQALLVEDRPELKRSVVRRMADKLGRYLLWNRVSSTPAIHELGALLPWWISHMPGPMVSSLRDIGLSYFLNGLVLPVQAVLKMILDSDRVYLGHCVCRSSGIVDDRGAHGRIVTLSSATENTRLLDRFVRRYECLRTERETDTTDPRYIDLCERLRELRETRSDRYRLETLLEESYPDWEFLPVNVGYTSDWIRSMHANRKAHLLHKELAFELALILYASKGILFTSMRLVDTPYAICSCPTPEDGGGCVLTNWYYWGMSNASLVPNEHHYGRRKDAAGNVLPCRFFPVRARRECVGCGCNHGKESPRGLSVLLEEADRIMKAYKARGRLRRPRRGGQQEDRSSSS
jgi:hypothetical protein